MVKVRVVADSHRQGASLFFPSTKEAKANEKKLNNTDVVVRREEMKR